jgi:guanine nucleotide-binding protein subunit alpha
MPQLSTQPYSKPPISSSSSSITDMADSFDPLSEAIKPPPNESEAQRNTRLAQEAEAQRISKEIDAMIAEENKHQDWRKKALKVLLLGQAESGKSTVLKSLSFFYNSDNIPDERRFSAFV